MVQITQCGMDLTEFCQEFLGACKKDRKKLGRIAQTVAEIGNYCVNRDQYSAFQRDLALCKYLQHVNWEEDLICNRWPADVFHILFYWNSKRANVRGLLSL